MAGLKDYIEGCLMPKRTQHTAAFVTELRRRWATRVTYKSLCHEYNLTKSQLDYLLKGNRRKGSRKFSDKRYSEKIIHNSLRNSGAPCLPDRF